MIQEDLNNDFKKALKEGDTLKKNTIQLLRSQIHLIEKDLDRHMERLEVEDLIIKERKKRIELMSQAEKIDRKDLMEQAKKEIVILEAYLPQQLSEYDLTNIVKDTIKEMEAAQKDIGKVIRKIKETYNNQVDGRMLSDIVKRLLEN